MPLSAGDQLGPYEIIAPIRAGGMGEVYRAHDPRLGRDVAIKVSAQQFSDRFEREARAIAALNHPNICQVYDIGPNLSIDSGYVYAHFYLALSLGFQQRFEEAFETARRLMESSGKWSAPLGAWGGSARSPAGCRKLTT